MCRRKAGIRTRLQDSVRSLAPRHYSLVHMNQQPIGAVAFLRAYSKKGKYMLPFAVKLTVTRPLIWELLS